MTANYMRHKGIEELSAIGLTFDWHDLDPTCELIYEDDAFIVEAIMGGLHRDEVNTKGVKWLARYAGGDRLGGSTRGFGHGAFMALANVTRNIG